MPKSTSAKMQPTLQMSMAGEYFAKNEPHSSGARYHLKDHFPINHMSTQVAFPLNVSRLTSIAKYKMRRNLHHFDVCNCLLGRVRDANCLPSCHIICPENCGRHVIELGPCQPKITNLELAIRIGKNILRLQISMKNFG